ncbi:hypothetical protein [Aestuariivirga sp.]|jgi:hypothetical protein|uniref:hypothetical protein n=1 Tax=Aestuariivirga sp. TaxID=2650926 RepID=UPI0037846194
MDTVNSRSSSSSSVFEASTKDPQLAINAAIDDIERLLGIYQKSGGVLDRMEVLTEIEALRRFVLVRGALIKCLKRPGRQDSKPIGRQICEALQGMVGDVPNLVKTCSLQGARNMERDTRRAIASLNFVGSLDPSFL